MTMGHCKKCGALMYTLAPRHLCDACTDAANVRAMQRAVEEEARFDAMTREEKEIYYAAAEAAWRQEEYGRLDA